MLYVLYLFFILLLDINDLANLLLRAIALLFSLLTICLISVAVAARIGIAGTIRAKEEEYKALIFKVQSEAVRDEFGLLNKEFIDEIQEWNKDIAAGQEWQDDFWIGIFYPPIYDKFETINLESMEFRK